MGGDGAKCMSKCIFIITPVFERRGLEETWRMGNEWIRGTMKTWSAVQKNLKLLNSVSRATKIEERTQTLYHLS